MDKFEKKIRKMVKNPENALVVGSGFNHLPNIVSTHSTVFMIDNEDRSFKSKNLIYREDFDHLHVLSDVRVIYFDLTKVDKLDLLKDFWQRHKSLIIIEGSEPIGRHLSKPLYQTNWGCVGVEKRFHVWEKQR